VASPVTVIETPAFAALVADYVKDGHNKLREDLNWLTGRLAEAPEVMGDHVPGLKKLPLPVFKTRCKDSCHQLAASAAWRVYYAIHGEKRCVFLLFLHHKKDAEAITALLEQRAWTVGSLHLMPLAERIWLRLYRVARGNFLAGLAGARLQDRGEAADWMHAHLPDCDFESASAAEVGACMAGAGQLDLLRAILGRSDLPKKRVKRLTGSMHQHRFEREIRQISTRLLDVWLEAAIRSRRVGAVKLLLERGANPNIPCWLLERSYNESFGALSFAIDNCRDVRGAETIPWWMPCSKPEQIPQDCPVKAGASRCSLRWKRETGHS